MTGLAPRIVMDVLMAVHVFLALWALVGLMEFAAARVPWPRVSNPLFPEWMLLAQWLAILPTAIAFLVGYALGWPYMPHAVTAGYYVMGALCAYQTVFLLQHETRYLAMAAEYAAYAAIAVFLFRSDHLRDRLAG